MFLRFSVGDFEPRVDSRRPAGQSARRSPVCFSPAPAPSSSARCNNACAWKDGQGSRSPPPADQTRVISFFLSSEIELQKDRERKPISFFL